MQSDKRTLKKVLLNLTSHGIKDNRPGGSLTISLRLQDGAAALGTRDQDRDMNAERAAQLFQPFNRLDAENRPTKGSGLGLVIARMSTQAMQGRLEVDCQPEAGSTFRLCLPLAAHAADTLRAPLPVLADKAGSASGPAGALLHIEDEPANALPLAEAPRDHPQWRLQRARDRVAGPAMARPLPSARVLTDIHLPGLAGLPQRIAALLARKPAPLTD